MITFETTFVCDGNLVLGNDRDCMNLRAGNVTKHKPDTQLPDGWMAVLLAGDARRELCPTCAKIWRQQQIDRTLPLTEAEVEEFREKCRRFDWAYAWSDDHAYYVDRDAVYRELQAEARRNVKLLRIFQAKGKEPVTA